ncbi:MAG: hypothetical protein JO331_04640 [Verrucomicrobia bacterium]|nr:hypothetical protein [Verrucomicrobiota bacterium]
MLLALANTSYLKVKTEKNQTGVHTLARVFLLFSYHPVSNAREVPIRQPPGPG